LRWNCPNESSESEKVARENKDGFQRSIGLSIKLHSWTSTQRAVAPAIKQSAREIETATAFELAEQRLL
jgi:hypothetical protein